MNFDKEAKSRKKIGGGGGKGGGGGGGGKEEGYKLLNTSALRVVILVWDTSSRPFCHNCKVL